MLLFNYDLEKLAVYKIKIQLNCSVNQVVE